MKNHLRHSFNTMYSPAHALAFRTDSFYDAIREQIKETLGDDAVGFGKGTILQQCKNALYRIDGNNLDLRRRLTTQFPLYCTRTQRPTTISMMSR
jgi:hypothetical protein